MCYSYASTFLEAFDIQTTRLRGKRLVLFIVLTFEIPLSPFPPPVFEPSPRVNITIVSTPNKLLNMFVASSCKSNVV